MKGITILCVIHKLSVFNGDLDYTMMMMMDLRKRIIGIEV